MISRGKLHTYLHIPSIPSIHVSAGQEEVEVNCKTFVRLHDVFAMMREVQAATGDEDWLTFWIRRYVDWNGVCTRRDCLVRS